MSNIPSCSTIVSLKASAVIPVTKFCMAIKLINNTESNSVGFKSLSGSCDLKIQDKTSSIIIISIIQILRRSLWNSRVKETM
jgi:hypothetical protein